MDFKHTKLANGLNIVGEVNDSSQSAAVGFFVKTGSRDESAEINGVSHFLEHMLFKGTDKLSALEVNAAFDRTGAQFNAFTSEENTVYYAAVLPEYLNEVTDIWCQLMRPALRDSDFDMEKNVILEEIAMYEDMPHFDVMDKARSLHFKNHPCGNSVLGSSDSIKALSAAQMREYFSRRYSPENITVACCGNFDWDSFCKLIEEKCSSWQSGSATRILSECNGSLEKVSIKKENLSRQHICQVWPSVSAQDKRKYVASLLGMILGDDTGSRFFWSLIDTAIAEVASVQYEYLDGAGAIYSYIRCSKENYELVSETIEQELEKLFKDGITQAELTMAKNKVLSTVTLKNELPMGRLIEVGFNYSYLGQYKTIEQEVASIKAVTAEEINPLIKDFDIRKFTQVTLSPAS